MGNKNKHKKRGKKPKVTQNVHQDQTIDATNTSKANNSMELECFYCNSRNETGAWLVQCDGCDLYIHFTCAGITSIEEDETWLCKNCQTTSKSNEETTTAEVHTTPGNILESTPIQPEMNQQAQDEVRIEDLNQTSEHLNDQKGTKSQISSRKSRSANSKVQTTSSIASSSRRRLELQRIEEEQRFQEELEKEALNLQLEALKESAKHKSIVDAETLKLQLEAIKQKKARQNQYLENKYKALSANGSSVSSKSIIVTDKVSYVSDWVNDQRKLVDAPRPKSVDENQMRNVERFNTRIDGMNFDSSIPVDEREIKEFRHHSNPTVVNRDTFLDNQVKQFKVWREKQKPVNDSQPIDLTRNASQGNHVQDPVSQSIQQNEQQNTSSYFIHEPSCNVNRNHQSHCQHRNEEHSNDNEHEPQYTRNRTDGTKSGERQQQQKISPSQNTIKFNVPPRSRSTMLNPPLTSTHRHKFNVQQPSTYTFARNTQPTNTYVTNSEYGNQQSDKKHTNFTNHSEKVERPTVSTSKSTRYVNQHEQSTYNQQSTSVGFPASQYYEQIYSSPNTVSSSMVQANQGNQHNTLGLSERYIPSARVDHSTMNEDNHSLTARQIAARHAITKDLPKFDGNPKYWSRFLRRYTNSTRMCGYSEDENLERLDKSLEGKAHDLVESLLLRPNSVPQIMERLYEKYGRPELIITAVLDEIRDYPAIKPHKLELLSNYGYVVKNACDQVEDLGLNNYLINPELIKEIVEKLPYQTQIDWSKHIGNTREMNLRRIADWLYSLSQAIDRILPVESSKNSNDKKNSNVGKSEKKSENYNKGESEKYWDKRNSKSGFVYLHENNKSPNSKISTKRCEICEKGCNSLESCGKFKGMDVEQRWESVKRNPLLCRRCLKSHKQKCLKSNACGVNGCEFKHHFLLHNPERQSRNGTSGVKSGNNNTHLMAQNDKVTQSSVAITAENSNSIVKSGNSNTHLMDTGELYRIVPVKLHFNGKTTITYAYLDEGSSFTLLERQTANMLGLSGTPETLCILWTNNVHRQEETENVDLEISGIMTKNDKRQAVKYEMKGVNVVQELNLPEQSLPLDEFKQRYEHLKDIPVAGYENVTPTMLIGLRHARLAVPLETIENDAEDGPIATRSRLGWSVYGPVNDKSKGYVNTHHIKRCPCSERDDYLQTIVKEHFTIENFGVSINSTNMETKENQKALEMLEKFTFRKGNRFETRLLWKNEAYILPDSYAMARKRLVCLENKGAETVKLINDIIEDYMVKGYASKVSQADLERKFHRTFYLPIFTVTNPKKPNKIRPVFDAAATVQGTSLNSTLYTGPDLLSSLVDILRRFREHKIAMTGDIKEMFHQVLINERDRHAQRFLWRNGDKNKEPEVYQFNVMTFGSKCSPSAAQFVKNTNAAEYESEFPVASKSIIENHYVDDMLDGARSVKDAIQLINDVKFIHSRAGFEIRNFKSNSAEVLKAIGESTEAGKVDLAEENLSIERVLGLFWDTESDCLIFSLKYTKVSSDILEGKTVPTKRELLKIVMSLFDPLGLIAHYVIHAKCLLQDVWRSKIGWDEKLPENLWEKWQLWIDLLPEVEKLKVPRWYTTKLDYAITPKVELHVFVDAGEEAFAAATYLRVCDDEGVNCSLVGAKARVTPLKYLSVPRKELMAALLGSRLVNSVKKGLSLKINRRIIWSDSITVLTWLHSEHKRYSQFVAHRVGEILENTNLIEWRWVPSKLNVADDATKWSKDPSFEPSNRWFTGPEFLQRQENEWPVPKAIIANSTTEEMKMSCSHSRLVIKSIVDASKFSTWSRLVRAVSNAKRIATWMVAKHKKENVKPIVERVMTKRRMWPRLTFKVSQEDLLWTERKLISQAQWENFTEEMVTLTRNKLPRKKEIKPIDDGSSIKDCCPYLDEHGILRVRGRIDTATSVSIDAKRPIILPKKNPITKLIVLSYHVRFKHRNHESVVNELRQRFYIPQIRTVVRAVRWNCRLCSIRRCKPKPPQMSDLPAIRFQAGIRPFTFTGIDYFGPLKVRIQRKACKLAFYPYVILSIEKGESKNSIQTTEVISKVPTTN